MSLDPIVHKRKVHSDYFQFEVARSCSPDSYIDGDGPGPMKLTPSGTNASIGVARHSGEIPVQIEVLEAPPSSIDPQWQHVAECSLEGHGGFQLWDFMGSKREPVAVPPSPLRMRVHWKGWASGHDHEAVDWHIQETDSFLRSETLLIQLWAENYSDSVRVLRNGIFREARQRESLFPKMPPGQVGHLTASESLEALDFLGRLVGSHLRSGDLVVVAGSPSERTQSFVPSILQGAEVVDPALTFDIGSTEVHIGRVDIKRIHDRFDPSSHKPEHDGALIVEHAGGFPDSIPTNALAIYLVPRLTSIRSAFQSSGDAWRTRVADIMSASLSDWRTS